MLAELTKAIQGADLSLDSQHPHKKLDSGPSDWGQRQADLWLDRIAKSAKLQVQQKIVSHKIKWRASQKRQNFTSDLKNTSTSECTCIHTHAYMNTHKGL